MWDLHNLRFPTLGVGYNAAHSVAERNPWIIKFKINESKFVEFEIVESKVVAFLGCWIKGLLHQKVVKFKIVESKDYGFKLVETKKNWVQDYWFKIVEFKIVYSKRCKYKGCWKLHCWIKDHWMRTRLGRPRW